MALRQDTVLRISREGIPSVSIPKLALTPFPLLVPTSAAARREPRVLTQTHPQARFSAMNRLRNAKDVDCVWSLGIPKSFRQHSSNDLQFSSIIAPLSSRRRRSTASNSLSLLCIFSMSSYDITSDGLESQRETRACLNAMPCLKS